MKRAITQELLRDLLDYSPETGEFRWEERGLHLFKDARSQKIWNTQFAGKPAFTYQDANGYRRTNMLGAGVYAHRAAWIWVNGSIPVSMLIDHVNQDKTDNRICNLRLASKSSNARNMKMNCTNTSGVTGVHWWKTRGKWVASIHETHLGAFDRFEDAVAARLSAEKANGYSSVHGRAA